MIEDGLGKKDESHDEVMVVDLPADDADRLEGAPTTVFLDASERPESPLVNVTQSFWGHQGRIPLTHQETWSVVYQLGLSLHPQQPQWRPPLRRTSAAWRTRGA